MTYIRLNSAFDYKRFDEINEICRQMFVNQAVLVPMPFSLLIIHQLSQIILESGLDYDTITELIEEIASLSIHIKTSRKYFCQLEWRLTEVEFDKMRYALNYALCNSIV